MSVNIHQQAIVFLYCFLCGIVCSCIFDMFRASRQVYNQSTITVTIADLLFWSISCFICFYTIFNIDNGSLRFYQFIALFFGSFLYFSTVSKSIKILFVNFFKLIIFILKILLTPARFLYKILSGVYMKIKHFFRKKFGGKHEANKNKKLQCIKKIRFLCKKQQLKD